MFDGILSWLARDDHPAPTAPPHPVALPAHPPRYTAAQVVARALSMVGRGKYGLGHGSHGPDAPTPFDADGFGDCSQFALAWVDGEAKHVPGRIDGDYLWCDGVYADAIGPHKMWRAIPIDAALPGDRVVYRGSRVLGVRKPGHCAVVVAVNGPTWAQLDCVDCHGGRGPAVGHRSGALWAKSGIVVRRVA
jgi:hypothetical protein